MCSLPGCLGIASIPSEEGYDGFVVGGAKFIERLPSFETLAGRMTNERPPGRMEGLRLHLLLWVGGQRLRLLEHPRGEVIDLRLGTNFLSDAFDSQRERLAGPVCTWNRTFVIGTRPRRMRDLLERNSAVYKVGLFQFEHVRGKCSTKLAMP